MDKTSLAIGLILTVGSGCLIGNMASRIAHEESVLSAARPVQAEILKVDTEMKRSSKGTAMYAPKINYKYMVDGRTYVADRVTIDKIYEGGNYASDITSQYHEGENAIAYVGNDASKSFLVRRLDFLYFGLIIFGLVFMSFGSAVLAAGLSYSEDGMQDEDWSSEHLTEPKTTKKKKGILHTLGQKSRKPRTLSPALAAASVYTLGGLLTLCSYYAKAPQPYSPASYIVTGLWAISALPLSLTVLKGLRS